MREALKEYILEKILTIQSLEDNPVLNNVTKAKKLDSFLKEILAEGKKKYSVKNNDSLFRIKENVRNVLGQLSEIWVPSEEEKEAAFNAADKIHEEDEALDNITWHYNLYEQALTLIDQAQNTSSYTQTQPVLAVLVQDKAKVKAILKVEKGINERL